MKAFKASCVLLALGAVACQESVGPDGSLRSDASPLTAYNITQTVSPSSTPFLEAVFICKVGPAGTYMVNVKGANLDGDPDDVDWRIDAGADCSQVTQIGGTGNNVVNVSEVLASLPSNVVFNHIEIKQRVGTTVTASTTFANAAAVTANGGKGAIVTIFNSLKDAGCSFTIGYWKTHDGSKKNGVQLNTPGILPQTLGDLAVTTVPQAVALLAKSGDASNGINKLYAQMLGAKLSIANGADPSAVSALIATADAFLTGKTSASWTTLSAAEKQMVIGWASTFDSYNNGLIGPGHCDE